MSNRDNKCLRLVSPRHEAVSRLRVNSERSGTLSLFCSLQCNKNFQCYFNTTPLLSRQRRGLGAKRTTKEDVRWPLLEARENWQSQSFIKATLVDCTILCMNIHSIYDGIFGISRLNFMMVHSQTFLAADSLAEGGISSRIVLATSRKHLVPELGKWLRNHALIVQHVVFSFVHDISNRVRRLT